MLLYSVLFPAAGAAIGPQLAAAIAVVITAWLFEGLAHGRWGDSAWLGSLWFTLGAATSLYTGRLTFAFGLAPAVATALALQRRRPALATACALLTAACSPVAALFAALAGAAHALGARVGWRRLAAGAGVVAAALLPVAALAIAFPEGGTEPFAFSVLWPLVVIAAGVLLMLRGRDRTLSAAVILYTLGVIASYAIHSAVGSNAARLGELVAGPLSALLLWPRRRWLLLAVAPALLYVQLHAPVRDVSTAAGDPSGSTAYYRPLLGFLAGRPGPPFRVEIPFTRFHWEAYAVAPRFPLARGWERQLDIEHNHLFYDGRLTADRYETWLHRLAVRYVAVSDGGLDYSAVREVALIDRGLPYLKLVWSSRHWRVYRVKSATAIAQGAATLRALGPNWLELHAKRPGHVLLRVRYTPYWKITQGTGCVAPEGQFTQLRLTRAGPVRLAIDFSLGRIGGQSPRCTWR